MQNSINPFNIRPANRVNNISEYYFSKKLKEIAELNARGLDIISLGIGGLKQKKRNSFQKEFLFSTINEN